MEMERNSWSSSIVYLTFFVLNFLLCVKAQCDPNGVTLTGLSGSFSSPNYPSDYPNSATCRWIISVPQGYRIQLDFMTFILETCSSISSDHVIIRDGSADNSLKLGEFCGNNRPPPTFSSGRDMWVEFDSDLTYTERGFLATYTAIAQRPQCNPNAVPLTASSGSFSSPNYPSDYPNSETCRWIISVPPGYIVRLEFSTFILQSCVVSQCSCDHVIIRDGSTENSPELGEFCGNNRPPPTYSSGRHMWVEFDSDRTINDRGFLATYTSIALLHVTVSTTKATKVTKAKNACSDPKHPSSCNGSLFSVCCFSSNTGPACCRAGGIRCGDNGKVSRDYCPRPFDDIGKQVCCIGDDGQPSCCVERSYCYHWFRWDITPAVCIGATVGILLGGGIALFFMVCICAFVCKRKPEMACSLCLMCLECVDNSERGCSDCNDCGDCNGCCDCNGCDDCCGECGDCCVICC